MHRVDGPGNVDGTFSIGDEEQGILATEMTADWPNAVQEEICNVIEAAGIGLNKEDNQQLLQAIQSMLDAVAVPVATVIYRTVNVVPAGYLACDGSAVSRVTYARLFAEIGISEGPGDGSTTFNLPDLRGEFIRGYDAGRGVDPDRVFGSAQADEIKSHSHPFTDSTVSETSKTSTPIFSAGSPDNGPKRVDIPSETASAGDTETRPRNKAYLACIKY